MERRLHLLESFDARGTDGKTYHVRGYEQLVRDPSTMQAMECWEPNGFAEYRLDDGTPVDEARDGVMRVHPTGVRLSRA